MRISVIVPVYKVEEYIEECIQGVLNQTYKDIELILVDDGSPDKSAEKCRKYLSDSRVKLIRKQNGGLSSARNFGAEKASGDYILFLDSDDYWEDSDALLKMAKILEKQRPDVLIFENKDLNCITGEITKNILTNCVYDTADEKKELIKRGAFRACSWNKAVSARMFSEHDLKFIEGITGEDNDWCARLLLYAGRIMTADLCFYVYRKYRNGSITNTASKKTADDLNYALEKCFEYAKDCNKEMQDVYFTYLSYFYMLVVATTASVSPGSKYMENLKKNRWVLNFGADKKTKLCKIALKVFGFNTMSRFLGLAFRKVSKNN